MNAAPALSFFTITSHRRPARLLLATAFAAAALAGFEGCASIKNQEAMQTELVLAEAGFEKKFADTSEKLAHLQTLPQRKLTPHEKDGQLWYVYADASTCRCLYAGPEDAYQRYQKLAREKQISETNARAPELTEMSPMNWEVWGGPRGR